MKLIDGKFQDLYGNPFPTQFGNKQQIDLLMEMNEINLKVNEGRYSVYMDSGVCDDEELDDDYVGQDVFFVRIEFKCTCGRIVHQSIRYTDESTPPLHFDTECTGGCWNRWVSEEDPNSEFRVIMKIKSIKQ